MIPGTEFEATFVDRRQLSEQVGYSG